MIEIHINTTAQHLDNLSDQLLLLGAHAITWQDAANQPIYEPAPGELIPWQQAVIVALFSPDTKTIATIQHYLSQPPQTDRIAGFRCLNVPDKDWVRVSLDQFQASCFGKRLWIVPSWQTSPDPAQVNVLIDPGLAFGTGTHPTTALCLHWLDEHILGGETIIDYGCGSGILTVAALKLGAKAVTAIDYDPQALEACRHNAALNQVDPMVSLVSNAKDVLSTIKADIILANILAKTIIESKLLLKRLLAPHGQLVLSGILVEQLPLIEAAFTDSFIITEAAQQDEWLRLTLIFK